ncbi:hypothetical protein ACR9E3_26560 [Actinomycetospora sp. C-140]
MTTVTMMSAHSLPAGLAISQHGYTLEPAVPTLPRDVPSDFRFVITGPDGHPVRDYRPMHDKELHLIVVRRDTHGFQHVHPRRDETGTWSVPLTIPDAGSYRVFADATPATADGSEVGGLILGADIAVAGDFQPVPLPARASSTEIDGYTVTLAGSLVAGQHSELRLAVSRHGRPITDLEPYLAAYGHLVALRVGDLAYLHVHPDGEPGDGHTSPGPEISFHVVAPSPGLYRAFLDFKHHGIVRTAAFTLRAART